MIAIFSLIYFLFLLFVLVASGFVVWHLLRYSMDRILAMTTVIVFIIVTGALVFGNILFFTQIPFDAFFTQTPSYNKSFGL